MRVRAGEEPIEQAMGGSGGREGGEGGEGSGAQWDSGGTRCDGGVGETMMEVVDARDGRRQ